MIFNFQKIVKQYNINIKGVIHVGAHYGNEYEFYKNTNIKNMLFFEPLQNNYKKLITNVPQTENIVLVNKALGNENKKVIMHVESDNEGQSSSILKPKLHTQQYSHIVFDKQEEVDMIILDEFLEKQYPNRFEQFNFINIDVQGYEMEVFKGSKNTLQHIDYIISEVNRAELYENNTIVYDLDKYLKQYGFQRVETIWEGVTWGDALYVKK